MGGHVKEVQREDDMSIGREEGKRNVNRLEKLGVRLCLSCFIRYFTSVEVKD